MDPYGPADPDTRDLALAHSQVSRVAIDPEPLRQLRDRHNLGRGGGWIGLYRLWWVLIWCGWVLYHLHGYTDEKPILLGT